MSREEKHEKMGENANYSHCTFIIHSNVDPITGAGRDKKAQCHVAVLDNPAYWTKFSLHTCRLILSMLECFSVLILLVLQSQHALYKKIKESFNAI